MLLIAVFGLSTYPFPLLPRLLYYYYPHLPLPAAASSRQRPIWLATVSMEVLAGRPSGLARHAPGLYRLSAPRSKTGIKAADGTLPHQTTVRQTDTSLPTKTT